MTYGKRNDPAVAAEAVSVGGEAPGRASAGQRGRTGQRHADSTTHHGRARRLGSTLAAFGIGRAYRPA